MTYRGSFTDYYGGGRVSPLASVAGAGIRNMSDMFEYMSPEDTRAYQSHRPTQSEGLFEDDDAPDVICLRYLGTTSKVEFPPFSISESRVYVKDVRQRVAERVGCHPARVRLVYKERDLSNDNRSLRYYGCRQNSEISAVVTEDYNDYGPRENQSSEEDTSISRQASHIDRRTSRANSSIRDRREVMDYIRTPNASGLLSPDNDPRQSRSTRRSPSPAPRARSPAPRDRSPAPPQTTKPPQTTAPPRSTATPIPSSPRRPTQFPADPKSPMGKVQKLQTDLLETWVPEAQRFIGSPPSDRALLDRERLRIVESMFKLVEAADTIDYEGDQEVRSQRKWVLTETQAFIKQVENAHK